jgi:hypothetical protein
MSQPDLHLVSGNSLVATNAVSISMEIAAFSVVVVETFVVVMLMLQKQVVVCPFLTIDFSSATTDRLGSDQKRLAQHPTGHARPRAFRQSDRRIFLGPSLDLAHVRAHCT